MNLNIKYLIIFFILCVFYTSGITQTFKGAAFAGVNLSQLDGDNNAGYRKVGIRAGISVGVNIKSNIALYVEMAWSQQGSSEKVKFISNHKVNGIDLNYIEVPLILKLYDWQSEKKDYYRVYGEVGLVNAYLVNQKVIGSELVSEVSDDFSRYSLGGLVGIGLQPSMHWLFGIRFVKSFNKLYQQEDPIDIDDKFTYLRGYYLNFQSSYLF